MESLSKIMDERKAHL